MMILVNGGSSCGKSKFAESLILKREREEQDHRREPSWYLATMIAWDEECKERIRKHRVMRKEKNFETIECPVDLIRAEVPANSRCLLECVSNLAANEMYRMDMERPSMEAKERILKGIRNLKDKAGFLVVVTNDVAGDQGTYSEETEDYRKLLGSVNRALADEADEVYEVICGIPVKLKENGAEEQSQTGKDSQRMDKKEDGITLVTGGAYQGKTDFAIRKATEKKEDHFICVADGSEQEREAAFSSEAVLNLHMYIRQIVEKEPDESRAEDIMYRFLDEIMEKNPEAVLTCDEIGCGIVPMEKKDRLWRELTGDACQYLAKRAKHVYRVVCGIPVALKGGEV